MFSVTINMRKQKSAVIYLLGIIAGFILIVIGVAGLFLPIIPGILLIIVGVVLFTGGSVGGLIKKWEKRAKKELKKIKNKNS